ncbi:MAG TPA: S8 family serine peptidase [Bryobacteraceae bacterium]
MIFKPFFLRVCLLAATASAVFAQGSRTRYALILEDPPVSERFAARVERESLTARSYRQQVEARQQTLRAELTTRKVQITGSVSTLLNAVFVMSSPDRAGELKNLPGVKGVVALRTRHLLLNRATQLMNAPAAWNALGGMQNAGAGMKIAILDTGIDQNHPAFQDSSLKAPAGFPVCNVPNCASFTNNKVIVARSYVSILAAGSDPNNPAADSRPDDYSPRDRVGHGSATASCAAATPNTGPAQITIVGMAPKAYLGNYKIFGSPQLNDGATDDAIIQALEDALNDHMDVASLSIGGAAFTGPLDTGAACGNAAGVPCDLVPPVVENAVKAGMVVVIAAGNDGDGQFSFNNGPALNTIESPGDAPSAITVGATTSSHYMIEGIEVPGAGVPSNLQRINGMLGAGTFPFGAVAGTLIDVTQLGDNGLACSALPAGSLNGAFALIVAGGCKPITKALNAQNAGAQGVILYLADQSTLSPPASVSSAFVPVIQISNNDGVALKSFIDANAGRTAFIDPAAFEHEKIPFNELAFFSSLGPTSGDNALKPDLVAVGGSDNFLSDIYTAAQSYDVLGDLYSANGYQAASGTSFSTPLVAGAAALVKQAHPNFTAAQIKSALVNTATQDVTSDEEGDTVGVQAVGAGKLDAGAAMQTNVTANPATISFGLANTLPITKQVQLINSGASSVSLSLSVATYMSAASASVAIDKTSLSLAAGASATVNVTLSGAKPSPGSYSGAISITGGAVPLRVPYLFLVGNGIVDNLNSLLGDGFDGTVGQLIPEGGIAIKLVDPFGVPVSGTPVTFTSRVGGGTIRNADAKTDAYGVAAAEAILGSQPGNYSFRAVAAGLSWTFAGSARAMPAISAGGIVNGASFEAGKPVAPGSYVSIFGNGLSDFTDFATTSILPLTIDFASVSFDVPSAKISVPGRLIFVSPGQVNVQVPWELQGQSQAQVKMTIDFSYGNVVTLALSDYAPAFFENSGAVAALDAKFSAITAGNPARQGVVVQLFANGLGPVNNQPATGDPAVVSPLATCKSTPIVVIGGKNAVVGFCGLAPGFPGLYQVNATVPTGLAPGANPITVAIGGQTSKSSTLLVQ